MKLKDYLKKKKITQAEFADILGMNRNSIMKYLKSPNQTPLVVKLAIEYITTRQVSLIDWETTHDRN